MAKGNMSARAFRRQRILGLLRGTVATVSSAMVAVAPALPAYADAIVADGRTDTQIVTSGNITDITTGTIHGGNAFNSFERFSVEQLRTVNLHQPDAAGALINVIRGGITNIDGTLNVLKGGEVGGNVFLVNPEGLVVGAGGVVNAGALTVSTGSHGFAERLIGADGAISDDAVAQLFAGTEELSPSAAIALYGEINARRLEMRVGARMILDGRINVIDAEGSQTAAPAVNTAGTENAAGVSVSGGVIRLHAEGDMQVGGQISAQAGNDGGRIAATAGGDIDVAAGAQISADGETGGSVFLFADGSALLEQGARISASAIAGDGGFIEFSARDHVGFAGELDVSSETGRAGTVYIDPANLTISTDIITGGANWILQADDTITVEDGVVISTRRIASGNHATAASTGNSGDLILSAREIVIEQNAGLYTHADAGYSGGLLALLARDDAPAGLPLLTDGPTARVDITGATLRGGAIYIGAYARATDVTTPSDPGSNGDFLKTALDVGLDVAGKLISGEEIKADDFVSSLQGLTGSFLSDIPAQFAALNATAEINITNSEITAQDNWAGMTADTEFDGTLSDNKVLAADGLAEDVYNFTGQNTSELTGKLASAFRESGAALYIHSHAQTDLGIAPQGDDPLNIVIAFSDTTSTLRITNSQLASAGDLVLNSTAHENFSGAIAAKSYANVTPGVVISARNLTNQLVVDGGAMTAGGTITAQALTGLNHDVTTAVDGGKDGVFALAAAVSIGSTLTEAALSGTIAADQGIDLRAETIWFKNSHAASATLGVDDPADAADESEENDAEDTNTSLTGFFDKLKDMVLGKQDPAPGEPEPENSKPGFAGALAVAITLDDNDTYASLGGSYRDLTDGSETTLGTTTVSAGDVAVNAGLRFASSDEGGAGISRVVTSSAASLSDKQRQELEKYNRDKPEDQQKTEEEFINEFGYGVFLNVPITSLTGTTQAELGGNLTITDATSVTAAASTAYPNARPWDDLRDFFTAYLDAATEFVSPETREDADEDTGDGDGDGEDGFGALPSLDSLDLDNYLTTKTGASATAPSGSGSGGSGGEGGGSGGTGTGEAQDGGQELAIGVTVGYFNTANTTRAVVRDGADITTTGALDVQALAEGFFYHRANEIELPKLDGGAGANNAIGGAINLARTVNTV
ncbi:MAG: leukotoxin LktA family filamentous adhesin, partial [Paracoccaceae bacterium]